MTTRRIRGRTLSALLLAAAMGVSALAVDTYTAASARGESRTSASAHGGHVMAASTQASGDDADGDGYIPAVPQV
ncbi:hypothetical protein ACFW89_30410, partial [Streptomyces albidoflavus]